jgi:hypothetical protein
LEINFNDITSLRSNIGNTVAGGYDHAREHSFDGIKKNLGILDLLVDKITIPSSNSIMMNSNTL